MQVVFASTLNVDFNIVKQQALLEFPEIKDDIEATTDLLSLETVINKWGVVMFVDVDLDESTKQAEKLALEIEAKNQKELDECICCDDIQPIQLDEEELKEAMRDDICQLLTNDEESLSFEDIEKIEFEEFQKELKNLFPENPFDMPAVKDMMDCITKMEESSKRTFTLGKQEAEANQLYVQLEDLKYNLEIYSRFYKKKLEVIEERTKTFEGLVIRKRQLKKDVDELKDVERTQKAEYELKSGAVGFGYSQEEATLAENEYKTTKSLRETKEAEYDQVIATISNERKGSGNSEDILNREFISNLDLRTKIDQLYSGVFSSNTSNSNISSFSTRPETVFGSNTVGNRIDIKFNFRDPSGILNGHPKKFLHGSYGLRIVSHDQSLTFHGVLYDSYYNIYGDMNKFFSDAERGLSTNNNNVDSSLKGTGAEKVGSKNIANLNKYKEFHSNFETNWKLKKQFVLENKVIPELDKLSGRLVDLGEKEVLMYLAYGKIYENLISETTDLSTPISKIKNECMQYLELVLDLESAMKIVQTKLTKIRADLEKEKQAFSTVPCALRSDPDPEVGDDNGSDPLGISSLRKTDPTKPNPTKMCYWLKFARLATTVNLLPLYWPIGLLIPNPSGVTKIPLPIVWIPLAVITLPVGIFVIFLGQCGMCPSPFVLYVGPNWEKKFLISLRPTEEFGMNAEDGIFKVMGQDNFPIPGIVRMAPMKDLIQEFSLPGLPSPPKISNADSKDSVFDDFTDKIIKKINKLGLPDEPPVLRNIKKRAKDAKNGIGEFPSQNEIHEAVKKCIGDFLDKLTLPELKLPSDQSKINPKPPSILSILDKIKFTGTMSLSDFKFPDAEKEVDLLAKLKSKISGFDVSEVEDPSVDYQSPDEPFDEEKYKRYVSKVKGGISKAFSYSKDALTASALGVVAQAADTGVTFFSPYQCKPQAKGITVPPLPGPVTAGIAAVTLAMNASLNLSARELEILNGGPITKADIAKLGLKLLDKLPMNSFKVPNPSVLNIKDMLKDSIKKVGAMQIPSIPQGAPQIAVTIPGSAFKSALKGGVDKSISDINILTEFLDFNNIDQLSMVDFKQAALNIVEKSLNPIKETIDPVVQTISAFGDMKDKSFAEVLGLKPPKVSDLSPMMDLTKMEVAFDYLKAMSLTPWAAAAVANTTFQKMHPILKHDDLPPWERLTLDNFLFVCFLAQFCATGKKGGGFYENP